MIDTESGRTMGEIMVAAGYSPKTAVAPTKLTKSKGWTEMLDEILPDDKLLKTHEEALHADKWNDFTGEREPDHNVRLKAVDMGYKVKHKTDQPSFLQQVNIGDIGVQFMETDVTSKG